jgi:hypothetical protein
VKYDDAFFNWLGPQTLMIDDYAYAGLEFQGDPNLVLLEGSQWGDLGKKGICVFFLQCFYEFQNIQCFCVSDQKTNQKNFDHADVGPHRPLGSSPIQR